MLCIVVLHMRSLLELGVVFTKLENLGNLHVGAVHRQPYGLEPVFKKKFRIGNLQEMDRF